MSESRQKILCELEMPASSEVFAALSARAVEWGAELRVLPDDERDAVEGLRERRAQRDSVRRQEAIRDRDAGAHDPDDALRKARAVWEDG
jgi:hypothetical protein